jgi:transcriptional regulator with XRE-family HTH domain
MPLIKSRFKIKPEDCSLLGQAILDYMEKQDLSMREFARRAGITQPGLRSIILKGGNPTESNISKLAEAMMQDPFELSQLVYQDKLREMADPDTLDVVRRVFDDIFNSLCELTGQLPDDERPSDYALLKTTFNTIKSFQS